MRFLLKSAILERTENMRKRFTKLFGNEDTKLRLCDAVVNSTLPHALLICGPRGSGKRTLATEIVAAANCLMKNDSASPIPCKVCANCKRIYSSSFPDVTFLERDGGKATIGVEELRDFRENMFLSASEAAYKFYVIEDADTMTSAAQNALLKVLEEPPKFVHIILLAESADKLLSTVKSRTQYVQMELFGQRELEDYVTELSSSARSLSQIAPDKLLAILLASGGVIGKAIEMMESESNYIILDVRTFEEYNERHIPGAICVPNESIGTEPIEELPQTDQLILVYCRSGRRSKEAAEKLAAMGYSNIYEFGGILDWTGETVSEN